MSRLDDLRNNDWGLVLSGGGGKGAFQIGVWQVLIQVGLYDKVKAISGSSIGALNLSLFAYDNFKLAHNIWSNVNPLLFLEPDVSKTDIRQGILKRNGLVELIKNYVNLETVSKSEKELFITATKCNKSGNDCDEIEYFKINGKSAEDIKDIMLASSALPYIFEQINIDGVVYRDGGIQDNLPIKPIYDAGYRNIIIIPLSKVVEIDIAKFPSVNFLTIAPSKNLGGLLSGTLDFSKEGSRERILQGVNDAVALFLNL